MRIGLAGTGFIAERHYNGFLNNKDSEIVGICSYKKTEKAAMLSEKWKLHLYENFEEMTSDESLDAIIIGSPNTKHYEQAIAAMKKGKHILIEKPVVTDISQIDILEKTALENNVVLFPAHNFVYRESVQIAKQMISEGKLGKIIYSSFMSTHTTSEEHAHGWRADLNLSSGGTLMDSGHHQVYMSLYLMGKPKKIQAFKSNLVLTNMEGEDIAQVNMLYPDDSIGNIMQSLASDYETGINGVKIFGDKGSLAITDALYVNGEKLSTDVDYDKSFENQAKAFSDCVLKGTKPLSTLDDVKATLQIIYGAYKSSETDSVTSF